jgi:hypothetical protein
MKQLTVIKTVPASNGEGFVTTLQSPTKVETVFGTSNVPFGRKYLINLTNELPIGKVFDVDLSNFDLRESTFEGSEGEQITVTWLNPR